MRLISEGEYIAHHGIKGMKWGVRRYQNEDGTLTSAGKNRYRSGKAYKVEMGQIAKKETERLQKNSKAYQKAKKESERILKKYQLDADDGGGGNTNLYDEETLRRAQTRYWNLAEDMDALNEDFYERGKKYAREQIEKKYGSVAFSDIEHYDKTNAYIAAASLVALLGTEIIFSRR